MKSSTPPDLRHGQPFLFAGASRAWQWIEDPIENEHPPDDSTRTPADRTSMSAPHTPPASKATGDREGKTR